MVEVCRTGAGVQQAHLQDLLVTAGCRCTSAGTKTGDTPTDNGLQHVVFCWVLRDFFPKLHHSWSISVSISMKKNNAQPITGFEQTQQAY